MLNHWTVLITFSFFNIFPLASLNSLFTPLCSSLPQPITEKCAFSIFRSHISFLPVLFPKVISSLSRLPQFFLRLTLYIYIVPICIYPKTFPFPCLTISSPQQQQQTFTENTFLSLQLSTHGRDVSNKLP